MFLVRQWLSVTSFGASASVNVQFESISAPTLNASAPWQVSTVLPAAAVPIKTLQHLYRQTPQPFRWVNSWIGQASVVSMVTWVTGLAVVLRGTETQEVASVQSAQPSIQTGVHPTGVQIYHTQHVIGPEGVFVVRCCNEQEFQNFPLDLRLKVHKNVQFTHLCIGTRTPSAEKRDQCSETLDSVINSLSWSESNVP